MDPKSGLRHSLYGKLMFTEDEVKVKEWRAFFYGAFGGVLIGASLVILGTMLG